MTDLDVARAGGVLSLTLDRPDQLNALTDELSDALAGELEAATSYDDVRVVVLRGRGSRVLRRRRHRRRGRRRCSSTCGPSTGPTGSCARSPVSTSRSSAAVHGAAAGVGCSIALASDLRGRRGVGVVPARLRPDRADARRRLDSVSVAASIGRARAMRMALLGEPLTGREAYDAGLVSHLADDDAFETVVADVVGRLVVGSAAAVRRRPSVRSTRRRYAGLDDALERERTGSDDAAAHPRRGRGHAGVRRTAYAGLRGGVMEQLRKALETRDAAAVEALLAETWCSAARPCSSRTPDGPRRWSSCAPRWRSSRTSATCGPSPRTTAAGTC